MSRGLFWIIIQLIIIDVGRCFYIPSHGSSVNRIQLVISMTDGARSLSRAGSFASLLQTESRLAASRLLAKDQEEHALPQFATLENRPMPRDTSERQESAAAD